MAYVVDAPLVLARDQEGKVHHCYQGAVIPWLPEDLAAHLLDLGMVHEVGGAPAVEVDEPEPAGPESGGKPVKVANKAVLVNWLMEHGTYDRDELEDQTKDELWALIEATD